jgi:hypothetical protein
LSQNGEDRVESSLRGAGGEQTKTPNGVPTMFWNMLAPTIYELFRGTLDIHPATQLLVRVPKSDDSFSHVSDSFLCNGRTPDVATGVSQEVILGFE